LAFHGYRRAEKTGGQSSFEGTEASRISRCQRSATAVKRFNNPIEPADFDLEAVTFISRFN
jgi:hypothetical protein